MVKLVLINSLALHPSEDTAAPHTFSSVYHNIVCVY